MNLMLIVDGTEKDIGPKSIEEVMKDKSLRDHYVTEVRKLVKDNWKKNLKNSKNPYLKVAVEGMIQDYDKMKQSKANQ
jgi:hypothetical protein